MDRKRKKLFLMVSTVWMMLLCTLPVQAVVKTVTVSRMNPVGISQGRIYLCDLNGDGKKEKIELKGRWPSGVLYINSKWAVNVSYFGRGNVYFVNVNRKDRYHEIFINDVLYRYTGKTLKKYAKGNYTSYASGHVRSTPGDGTIYYTGCLFDYKGQTIADTFYDVYPTIALNMVVKKGKIQINSGRTHKIVSDNCTWLKKSIRVTSKAGSGKAFTIPKWRNVVLTAYRYGSKYSYIQVKDRCTGKMGWYRVSTSRVKPMGSWE